ncbi:nitrite reductase small subunit NirD [Paremcibacter congregatus]|uniref:Nitrite reductase (NAD(P)H) small subunit n=1 Tax=Paremcibacter congregatus TaxID=2043170 RepID=A0A2G4YS38_9PROT|nr:nitrite reductase small subunit NirD [Paremcibacter congregatus]PHZ85128.1 nitrite reductase (NAD(P)H) small subunit [Paremcibacter congregatus]QDE27935.1 nitrite reductase small subunit NirD [Paremcibacter congregatus]
MKPNWIEVGLSEDIPYLGSRVIKTGGTDIAIFKTATGELFALEDKCPHKGGPLSQGIVHGRSVSCPLHNWDISLEDGEALGPDSGCSHVIAVDIKDGIIYLDLPSEMKAAGAHG